HVSGRIHVLETIGYGFDWLRTELAWAPDILTAGVILLLSVALALALYGVIDHFVQPLAGYHPYARTVTSRIRGPMRLAFVVIALFAAVPAAPLDDGAKRLVARILALGVIGLIGWAVMRAIEGAASIYLLRFRLDVEDNLLARKHVTQVRILLRTLDVLIIIITLAAALMTFEPVR